MQGSRLILSCIFALFLTACASLAERPSVIQDASFDRLTADKLYKFESEAEFRRYLKTVKRKGRSRGIWWAKNGYTQLAQNCDPALDECDEIVVTGAKASSSSSAANITNTQNVGVDEGDIVKQVGRFLIVLQDGRLFTIETGAGPHNLAVLDRINVYRDNSYDAWYDELLVFDDLLLVTGYSYDAEATELAVFKISDDGKISRQGTFYKSSDDYYDTDNYATRLVEDTLIIYTPIYLTEIDTRKPIRWPVMRKWIETKDKGEPYSKGKNMFGARDIYYPIQRTAEPVLHSVSICPLGDAVAGGELDCDTTAFIGPARSEYYVSKEAAFLWVSPGRNDLETDADLPVCAAELPAEHKAAMPSALFRLPLNGDPLEAAYVKGRPVDQFSLESTESEFKALLQWDSLDCEDEDETTFLKYFATPLRSLSYDPRNIAASKYTDLPSLKGWGLENRFTDDYLVYGNRKRHSSYASDTPFTSTAVAVETANPKQTTSLALNHGIIRIERAGGNVVLTGHKKNAGLYVSMVDLKIAPRLSDTLLIPQRYESEGRSHAFNSQIKPDGSGLIGLPTTRRVQESGRNWWRSVGSDVSFMSVDAQGDIRDLGFLTGDEDSVDDDYECEMSCVDWYGNTRPIFIGNRVFALIGTELVEGRAFQNSVRELKRVNLSRPLK